VAEPMAAGSPAFEELAERAAGPRLRLGYDPDVGSPYRLVASTDCGPVHPFTCKTHAGVARYLEVPPSEDNPPCEDHSGGPDQSGPPSGSYGLPSNGTADGSAVVHCECHLCGWRQATVDGLAELRRPTEAGARA